MRCRPPIGRCGGGGGAQTDARPGCPASSGRLLLPLIGDFFSDAARTRSQGFDSLWSSPDVGVLQMHLCG